MPVITSKKRLTSKRKSYTLFLPVGTPAKVRDKEIEYNKKLKRIPEEADLVVVRVSEGMIIRGILVDSFKYIWTWYETEIP